MQRVAVVMAALPIGDLPTANERESINVIDRILKLTFSYILQGFYDLP